MVQVTADEARQLAYSAILSQLAEGVIVTDAVGTITFVNRAAAAIHGVARLDVKPNAYSEAYHLFREDGRIYPSHELPLARAVRGETVKDARWRIRRPDGREVLAIGTAQPLQAPDGRRIGAVLTLRDATEHAAAERSLEESQSALRDANKQLAARGRHKNATEEQGSSDTICRLRASLNEIRCDTQALQQAATVDEARQCGARMQAIISTLLALVDRLDGGAPPVGTTRSSG